MFGLYVVSVLIFQLISGTYSYPQMCFLLLVLVLGLRLIGVLASLHGSLLVSLNKSRMYFYCEMKILDFEWVTSIYRKYFNFTNYLISNPFCQKLLCIGFSFSSPPVIMISSTYTKKIVTPIESKFLINRVWSPLACLYPKPIITFTNILNHILGDCLSP